MNKIYKYKIKNYNFIKEIRDLFKIELCELHTIKKQNYNLFLNNPKNTDCTEFHNLFYTKLRTNWKIKEIYTVDFMEGNPINPNNRRF